MATEWTETLTYESGTTIARWVLIPWYRQLWNRWVKRELPMTHEMVYFRCVAGTYSWEPK